MWNFKGLGKNKMKVTENLGFFTVSPDIILLYNCGNYGSGPTSNREICEIQSWSYSCHKICTKGSLWMSFGTKLFFSKPQCEVSVPCLCTLNPENRDFWELCWWLKLLVDFCWGLYFILTTCASCSKNSVIGSDPCISSLFCWSV